MKKLPYGIPIVVVAIIAGLTAFSLSPKLNNGGGFEFLNNKAAAVILTIIGAILLVSALIFLINTFYLNYQETKEEKERENE